MELIRAITLTLTLVLMVALVSSDMTKDRQECQEQLISLSSCLNYVAGAGTKPSPQCCAILDEKINKTRRCLCVLVRDRNEPSLGLKLNATRALILPSICHASSNSMDCLGLLGLSPNSTDAQIFIQAANYTQADYDKPSKNDGLRRWAKMGMLQVILIWSLVSVFI